MPRSVHGRHRRDKALAAAMYHCGVGSGLAAPGPHSLHQPHTMRMVLRMELWELAAREAIRDVVAAYAHAADSGRFDEVAALFAADGVLETPDHVEHRGCDAIRAFVGGTGAALAGATTVP